MDKADSALPDFYLNNYAILKKRCGFAEENTFIRSSDTQPSPDDRRQ